MMHTAVFVVRNFDMPFCGDNLSPLTSRPAETGHPRPAGRKTKRKAAKAARRRTRSSR